MIFEGVLHGKTVSLRSVAETDAAATLAMRLDSRVNKYLAQVEDDVEKQRSYIKSQRKEPGDYLFIAEDMNGKPIGMRRVNHVSRDGKSCETGSLIGLGNAVQNTEIALLGYDFAFQILGVERIDINVVIDNVNVANSQRRYGAVEVRREFDANLGFEMLYQELTFKSYKSHRASVYGLIERLGR